MPASALDADRLDWLQKAFNLLLAHYSYAEVSRAINAERGIEDYIPEEKIYRAIQNELIRRRKNLDMTVDIYRHFMYERLNMVGRAALEVAVNAMKDADRLKALEVVLKVADRQSAMMGITSAPATGKQLSIQINGVDMENI